MEKTDKERILSLERRVTKLEKFIEKGSLSRNGRLVHCDHIDKKTNKPCGHSWVTRSEMDTVSCPKCGSKVKINNG